MQPLEKMAAQIRGYRDAWNSPDAKPISDVATNKVAAYTLVHCAETNDQARDNGVWESVAWWYQNIAEFTLKWELPHLPPEARRQRSRSSIRSWRATSPSSTSTKAT